MNSMPFHKYPPYPPSGLSGRSWPDRVIERAPRWCSVDLRDGNQALSVPMDVEKKMEMFRLLVRIGFKEIEVGFPSASETEYRFVRELIEGGHIPGDVVIQVLTQARKELIDKTLRAVSGARRAIVHVYNSTSRNQREIVFRMDREAVKGMAVAATRMVREKAPELAAGTAVGYEYTPESFTATEPDFALEVCDAVIDGWAPEAGEKVIINLPSTVEMSTPNVYADRIEWMGANLARRGNAVISVHPHNDRGTGVAAAELAILAGAERVEGALFGNGERSGNLDILTVALNLFSQGVDPCLDFSHIDEVIGIYCRCTGMPVHPRHPYAGELVYTAFSGSHQDAISKGMKAQKSSSSPFWNVPYLPIDPQDVGRSYQAIIRVNSQSGKGGAAFILERDFGISIPRWMQQDFGKAVQAEADRTGKELLPADIHDCFMGRYITSSQDRIEYCHFESGTGFSRVKAAVVIGGRKIQFSGQGNGPIEAFIRGLDGQGIRVEIADYAEFSLDSGADASAIAFIHTKNHAGSHGFGAGIDKDISMASIKAVMSSLASLE